MPNRRIFGFWTGDNPMPEMRRNCWETFHITGLEPTMVTSENLEDWIVSGHPLPEAYWFLSPVHRADYLRAYFMYHHGGGYADIKRQTGSWLPAIAKVENSSRLYGAGYREIRGGTVHLQNSLINGQAFVLSFPVPRAIATLTTNLMRAARPLLIGNGAYYFRPQTPLVGTWLREAERRLDMLTPKLRECPALEPRDRLGNLSGYPIPWSFILGDIFHPLAMLNIHRLSRDLPRPSFENYQ